MQFSQFFPLLCRLSAAQGHCPFLRHDHLYAPPSITTKVCTGLHAPPADLFRRGGKQKSLGGANRVCRRTMCACEPTHWLPALAPGIRPSPLCIYTYVGAQASSTAAEPSKALEVYRGIEYSSRALKSPRATEGCFHSTQCSPGMMSYPHSRQLATQLAAWTHRQTLPAVHAVILQPARPQGIRSKKRFQAIGACTADTDSYTQGMHSRKRFHTIRACTTKDIPYNQGMRSKKGFLTIRACTAKRDSLQSGHAQQKGTPYNQGMHSKMGRAQPRHLQHEGPARSRHAQHEGLARSRHVQPRWLARSRGCANSGGSMQAKAVECSNKS